MSPSSSFIKLILLSINLQCMYINTGCDLLFGKLNIDFDTTETWPETRLGNVLMHVV